MNNLKRSKLEFSAPSDTSGIRLDRYLLSSPEVAPLLLTRSHLQNLIDKGFVLVNNRACKASYTVKPMDHIVVEIPITEPTSLQPYNFPLDIVYEDDDLIVINKPSGLVMHPAAGHEQDTLVNALLYHTQNLSMKNELRPGIVHRIDKETSGLVVVAKNDYTHEHLALQFKNKETHRVYFAIAEGHIKFQSGSVKTYLARHPSDRKRYASVKENGKIITKFEDDFDQGKWAITHYQALEFSNNKTLVRLKLETGRTHQIRVHMSELGNSLVGDLVYGYSVQKYKTQNLKRFFLHAAELGFTHPKTLESMLFKTGWPKPDAATIASWGFSKYE